MNATVVVGAQGRIVVPADLRAEIGLAAGDRLVVRVQGRGLVLERPEDAVTELRALGAGVARGRSLVEELLSERRLSAAAE